MLQQNKKRPGQTHNIANAPSVVTHIVLWPQFLPSLEILTFVGIHTVTSEILCFPEKAHASCIS